MNLSAPINELKRKAKLLGRAAGIRLNQAYARIAKEEGYTSWGLLIRDYKVQRPKPMTAFGKMLCSNVSFNERPQRAVSVFLLNAQFGATRQYRRKC